MQEFFLNKIDKTTTIEAGSLGKVYAYKENNHFAISHLEINKDADILLILPKWIACQHSNVLPIHEYCLKYNQDKTSYDVFIKLDRMKCSLKAMVTKNNSTAEIITYALGLASGLKYLQDERIPHAKLRPDNILIDANNRIQIASFLNDDNEDKLRSLGLIILGLCNKKVIMETDSAAAIKVELNNLEDCYSRVLKDPILMLLEPPKSNLLDLIIKKLQHAHFEQSTENDRIPEFTADRDHANAEQNQRIEEEKIQEQISSEPGLQEIIKELKQNFSECFNMVIIPSKIIRIERKTLNFEKEKFSGLLRELKKFQETERYIKELDFNLCDCQQITDEEGELMALFIGRGLRKVQEINVNLNLTQITDKTVCKLADRVENLPELKRFNLDVYSTQITDDGILTLVRSICQKLHKIEELTLYLSNTRITDQGVKELMDAIVAKISIKRLSISLDWAGVTDETKQHLDKKSQDKPNFSLLKF